MDTMGEYTLARCESGASAANVWMLVHGIGLTGVGLERKPLWVSESIMGGLERKHFQPLWIVLSHYG